MPDNGPTIIELDRKRMAAMAQKDIATLNAVLADDLVYAHSSARLDTKQSLIGAMESGATVYTLVEPSDSARIRRRGFSAVSRVRKLSAKASTVA